MQNFIIKLFEFFTSSDIKDFEVIKPEIVEPKEVMEKYRLANTKELFNIYGIPTEKPKFLETIDLPYPMRLNWDKKIIVNKMRCHRLVASDFENIFHEIENHYGYDEIKELGIDLFGGCFNFRKMRGGSDLSRHSWGIAIDLDTERNGLKTPFNKANFSKPEYNKLHEIFEKYGFLNLGKEKNFDSMHWEKGIKL